jgi:hypothetical protein
VSETTWYLYTRPRLRKCQILLAFSGENQQGFLNAGDINQIA